MVSVCLPSDALSQHLPSYLGFSYLGRGVSLHGCSSKAQPLLLTLDEGISSRPPLLTLNVEQLLSALLRLCSCCSLDVGLLLVDVGLLIFLLSGSAQCDNITHADLPRVLP